MGNTVKNILNAILSFILWVVILTAALFAFVTLATRDQNKIASIAGFSPLTVQSESMKPTFSAGDLIIIKSCDPETLQVGDVVTFHTIIENQYALNTHRIKEIYEENGIKSYVTKGDNNALEDTHTITGADVVGEYVTTIPKFGKVMNFLSSSIGFLLCIVLPLLIFFVYQIYHLIMIAIELKKATALEEAIAIEEAKEKKRKKKAQAKVAAAEDSEDDSEDMSEETRAALAEAEKARKALEEARRMQAEAEAALAKAKAAQDELNK